MMSRPTVLIYGLCWERMVDEALPLYSQLKGRMVLTPDAYSSLILGLCNTRRWREAVAVLRETVTKRVSLEGFVYDVLVSKFTKNGMADDVSKIMTRRSVRSTNTARREIWIEPERSSIEWLLPTSLSSVL